MADIYSSTVERPLTPGIATELTPLVRRINAGNAGLMTGAGTNAYLVGCKEIAVIDPGPALDAHVDAIIEQAGGTIRWVLATHTHPDHSPAAKLIAARTGAELIGCVMEDDGHQDGSFQVAENIQHGWQLRTDEFTLEAIATPGHVGNHFCYWLPEDQVIFTGDHIMQGTTVVIVPPSGDMACYIESLKRLSDYPANYLAPGHGHLMSDATAVADALVKHRLAREALVVAALGKIGEASIEALVEEVYADVDPALHKVAAISLWAHLLKLEKEHKVVKQAEAHWLLGREVWCLVEAG